MSRTLPAALVSLAFAACGPQEAELSLSPEEPVGLATAEAELVSEPNGTCVHPVTSTGVKLTATCSLCAGKVCAADPYCCNSAWDSLCVGAVPKLCGSTTCTPKTCSGLGAACGSVADGCGGSLSCGTCAAGSTCSANKCVASSADAGTQLAGVVNGSFEGGSSPWLSAVSGGNGGASSVSWTTWGPARTGTGALRFTLAKPAAYVVGINSVKTSVKQQVVLPATASSLKVWVRSSWPTDFQQQVGLKATLVSPISGVPVAIGTASNAAYSAYTQLSINVSQYAGKAVTIEVYASTSRYLDAYTSWPSMSAVVDDVELY